MQPIHGFSTTVLTLLEQINDHVAPVWTVAHPIPQEITKVAIAHVAIAPFGLLGGYRRSHGARMEGKAMRVKTDATKMDDRVMAVLQSIREHVAVDLALEVVGNVPVHCFCRMVLHGCLAAMDPSSILLTGEEVTRRL